MRFDAPKKPRLCNPESLRNRLFTTIDFVGFNRFIILLIASTFIIGILIIGRSHAQDKQSTDILNQVIEKWKTIDTYHCKMRSRNRLGERQDTVKMDFWFKKEKHQVRMEVLDGDRKGSVLARDAQGILRGRKGGLLKIISVTLDESDERTTNLRGRKFYHADWGTVLDEIAKAVHAGSQVSILPDEVFNGIPCTVVSIEMANMKTSISKDVFWISKNDHLILCRKQYEQDLLVNEVVWWDIELNIPVEDSFFEL